MYNQYYNTPLNDLLQEAELTQNQLALAIHNAQPDNTPALTAAIRFIADQIATAIDAQCEADEKPDGDEYRAVVDYLTDCQLDEDKLKTTLTALLEEIDAPTHHVNIPVPFDTSTQAVTLLERFIAGPDYRRLTRDIHNDALLFDIAHAFSYGRNPSGMLLDYHPFGEREIETAHYIEDLPDDIRHAVQAAIGDYHYYNSESGVDISLSTVWLAAWLTDYYQPEA